jgi:transposase
MSNSIVKSEIKVLGIDLAKNSFHLHGVDAQANVVLSKRVSRQRLLSTVARLPACLVGVEACGGAHYWARAFGEHGHEVRMMAPQFVKPYVKSNKSDRIDAEAICEAVQRPSMRFVPIKAPSQQDLQSLHRARRLALSQRTAQVNQIRGLLAEYGIVIGQGRRRVRGCLPGILEDAENGLSVEFRELLQGLYEELVHLDERIEKFDQRLEQLSRENAQCRRLMMLAGIGPLVATALVAAVGDDVGVFKNGRQLAAWLGLVPRQCSTGGKTQLLGISKRGDPYLRTLLIHGARSVVRCVGTKADRRSRWIRALEQRRGRNVAVVAVANKIARTAWALLHSEQVYQTA